VSIDTLMCAAFQRHYAPIELRVGQGVMPKEAMDRRMEAAAVDADITFQPAIKAVSTVCVH
jgi:hypothetical protein